MQDVLGSPLGKPANYVFEYDANLLFPISRQSKRELLGLKKPLPFTGVDLINAYELSWLNAQGKPEIAIAEIQIPCQSPYLIESKSLKLYLNSFNQTAFSDIKTVRETISKDLSAAVEKNVSVKLLSPVDFATQQIEQLPGTIIDDLEVYITEYQPQPNYLIASDNYVEEKLLSRLLKSNCPVTGQPDWATLWIHYQGKQINHEGLLKYIISLRNHTEFHEQCIERIFLDLKRYCQPDKLTVYARYTRRGGIDINPYRSDFSKLTANIRLARQ